MVKQKVVETCEGLREDAEFIFSAAEQLIEKEGLSERHARDAKTIFKATSKPVRAPAKTTAPTARG